MADTEVLELEEGTGDSEGNISLCLMGRVLNPKPINLGAVTNIINSAWKTRAPVRITPWGNNNTFLFKFDSVEEKMHILKDGPWSIMNNLLVLKALEDGMIMSEIDFSRCPIWVQIHGLPVDKMSQPNAKIIGKRFGKLLAIECSGVEVAIAQGETVVGQPTVDHNMDRATRVVVIPSEHVNIHSPQQFPPTSEGERSKRPAITQGTDVTNSEGTEVQPTPFNQPANLHNTTTYHSISPIPTTTPCDPIPSSFDQTLAMGLQNLSIKRKWGEDFVEQGKSKILRLCGSPAVNSSSSTKPATKPSLKPKPRITRSPRKCSNRITDSNLSRNEVVIKGKPCGVVDSLCEVPIKSQNHFVDSEFTRVPVEVITQEDGDQFDEGRVAGPEQPQSIC
ncbi:hypothetical protein Vadar_005830 [Vaccinium darrowii]|uniref:Uncharacterized protein n=1 Tax=Vaccinium darrowii TaxID=229202 RepID=A0ACB7Z3G1_9ERIC|nr:hypothetical protein Vadar_005830 [Vaccinium darrowii]